MADNPSKVWAPPVTSGAPQRKPRDGRRRPAIYSQEAAIAGPAQEKAGKAPADAEEPGMNLRDVKDNND